MSDQTAQNTPVQMSELQSVDALQAALNDAKMYGDGFLRISWDYEDGFKVTRLHPFNVVITR